MLCIENYIERPGDLLADSYFHVLSFLMPNSFVLVTRIWISIHYSASDDKERSPLVAKENHSNLGRDTAIQLYRTGGKGLM